MEFVLFFFTWDIQRGRWQQRFVLLDLYRVTCGHNRRLNARHPTQCLQGDSKGWWDAIPEHRVTGPRLKLRGGILRVHVLRVPWCIQQCKQRFHLLMVCVWDGVVWHQLLQLFTDKVLNDVHLLWCWQHFFHRSPWSLVLYIQLLLFQLSTSKFLISKT